MKGPGSSASLWKSVRKTSAKRTLRKIPKTVRSAFQGGMMHWFYKEPKEVERIEAAAWHARACRGQQFCWISLGINQLPVNFFPVRDVGRRGRCRLVLRQ